MVRTGIGVFLDLYAAFFKIGAVTFGGGLAMLPMLRRELIERRGWITEEELIDYYAIGQTTPGIIAVNVATFAGHKKAGAAGGIVATLGIVTPSVIIISVLAGLISSISDFPRVQSALRGVNVAVAALLTDTVIGFAKKTITGAASFLIAAAAFSAVYFLHAPSFVVIPAAAALGVVLYLIGRARGAGHGGGNGRGAKDGRGADK